MYIDSAFVTAPQSIIGRVNSDLDPVQQPKVQAVTALENVYVAWLTDKGTVNANGVVR